MKNSLANIPFLKAWWYYFLAIGYKLKSKHLLIGHLNQLENCSFGAYNALGDRVNLKSVVIGNGTYISYDTVIRETNIGKFCSIGPRCLIGLGKHPTAGYLSTHPVFYSATPPIKLSFLAKNSFTEYEPIQIGNDVWIGASVIILDGVTIGNGAIIAAGSVVTKNVEPYSIVKGIPAKHTKFRFSAEEITTHETNPWWNKNWDELEKIIRK